MLEWMGHPGATFLVGLAIGVTATLLIPWLWHHVKHKWLWLLALFASLYGVIRFGWLQFASEADKHALVAVDLGFALLCAIFGVWALFGVLAKIPRTATAKHDMLKPCVACGEKVSVSARICPYCSHPDPTKALQTDVKSPKQAKPA